MVWISNNVASRTREVIVPLYSALHINVHPELMDSMCGLTRVECKGMTSSLILLATLLLIEARMSLAFLANWAHFLIIFNGFLIMFRFISTSGSFFLGLPTLQQINTLTPLVVCEFASGRLIHIIKEDIKQDYAKQIPGGHHL
ncbi:hypothetical protein HGM15179_012067 [Zosterops borbonicus]|uniref:Uncharacterized protein n=1 Tax=Zosterops borbonicus TaxID=364589 RepID=A0A8K1LIK9_9PASS|nr:hypothetical protein HGM15179_012067 [Zosterops borbonicus]